MTIEAGARPRRPAPTSVMTEIKRRNELWKAAQVAGELLLGPAPFGFVHHLTLPVAEHAALPTVEHHQPGPTKHPGEAPQAAAPSWAASEAKARSSGWASSAAITRRTSSSSASSATERLPMRW
jgi:hypothetical protein